MLSLALPHPTWAHRLPAGFKLGALALAMIGAMQIARPEGQGIALIAVAALYATLGWAAMRHGLAALRPVLWIVAALVIWQAWIGDPRQGIALGLRVLVMVGLANFVTLTTPLPELIALIERLAAPLSRFGLSPRLPALAVAMVLRFIPVLQARLGALQFAWRARARRRSGPRLIVPLTLSLLDDSDHLAEALRARGGLNPRAKGRNSNGT